MALSNELISQFAKLTKGESTSKKETTVYGTAVQYNGSMYVRIDGSDLLTPISSTAGVKDGERVTVMIKDHSAIVNGNISSPSASTSDIKDLDDKIINVDKIITENLKAETARIDELVSKNITVEEKLTASEAEIDDLKAKNVTIEGTLTANKAEIEDLQAKKLDAESANLKYATIENLNATNADIYNLTADFGEFKNLTTENFKSDKASIEDLQVKKLDAESAELKYANIDFANIDIAAIEKFFSKSGVIGDLVVGEGFVTGTLVGVTVKGDLIEGGTVVADKLVIKGTDGLYYKLNTDGVTTEAEQTDYNSLNGSIITAKSITATKISVDDLVAFDATIGGFNITENSIYSGVKESVNNTTRGVYLDNEGQVAFGDSSNFIKYYKDQNGKYRLAISAESMIISSSNTNVADIVDEVKDVKDTVDNIKIGGRNLLLKSNVETTNNYYEVSTYYPSELFVKGEQYAVTVCLTPANGVNYIRMFVSRGMGFIVNLPTKGTDKQVVSTTFTFNGYYTGYEPTSITDTNAIVRFYRMPNDSTVTGNTTIHYVKLEKGNKATDWTPAPEDVDSAISNAQTAADDAKKSATTANNLLSDIANDNKLTSTEKQEALKEWNIISGEYSKITSEANKYSVSTSTYTTNYNTLKNYLSPLFTNMSTTSDIVGSTFRTNFTNYYNARQDVLNSITSAIKTYSDNIVENLEIGGTNLLLKSKLDKEYSDNLKNWSFTTVNNVATYRFEDNSFYFTTNTDLGTVNNSRGILVRINELGLKVGDTITVSLDIRGTAGYDHPTVKETKYAKITIMQSTPTGEPFWSKITRGTDMTGMKTDTFTRYSFTYTITEMYSGYNGLYIFPSIGFGGEVWYKNIKLERGNKATDWTPAPEDVQEQIDNTITQLDNMASDSKLTPQEKLSVKTEWEVIASEYSKYNTQASAYAVSTTAYYNAYSALNTYLNATNTGVLFSMSSTTNISRSEFNSKFKTYYDCRTELSNAIATAKAKYEADNIVVGGRNIARGTNQGANYWSYAFANGTKTVESYTTEDGIDAVKLTCTVASTSWQYTGYDVGLVGLKLLEPNTEYTVSFDLYPSISHRTNVGICRGNATGTISPFTTSQNYTANQWNKIELHITTNELTETLDSQVLYFYGFGAVGEYIIKNLKLEKGNKATDWTPSPEDVYDKINEEINIVNKVIEDQSTDFVKTATDITLSALESYVTTTEFGDLRGEIESQFKVLADSINGSVTSITEELQEINGDLQTKFNTITKYFTFDINGLTIGQEDNPYKVIIDNDKFSMQADGIDVMYIENGEVYTPEITIKNQMNLFEFSITKDENGNINCEYVG